MPYLLLFLMVLVITAETSSCSLNKESLEGNSTCARKLDDTVRPYFINLKEKIKQDLKERVPEDFVEKVLCSEEVEFKPELMVKSLTWREVALPYHQFLEKERVERAFSFLCQHSSLLTEIEKKFDVEKEVIVSILLVETDLGRKTGKHPVINTYLSLTLTGNETLFLNYLPANGEIDLNNETTKLRYQRRANWAYGELLYALEYLYRHNATPSELKGSIFGAFGYPQFVPKSYFIYGYDWDGDGKVNLFDFPDSFASIANYLAKEGYRRSLPWDQKLKVVMKYNKSEPYAKTVLELSEILKKRLLEAKDGEICREKVEENNT